MNCYKPAPFCCAYILSLPASFAEPVKASAPPVTQQPAACHNPVFTACYNLLPATTLFTKGSIRTSPEAAHHHCGSKFDSVHIYKRPGYKNHAYITGLLPNRFD